MRKLLVTGVVVATCFASAVFAADVSTNGPLDNSASMNTPAPVTNAQPSVDHGTALNTSANTTANGQANMPAEMNVGADPGSIESN